MNIQKARCGNPPESPTAISPIAIALKALAILALTLVSACTTPREPVEASPTLTNAVALPDNFSERPDIPLPADIHRLTPEQEQDFLAWMADPANAGDKPNMRLFHYLENVLQEFSYEGKTLNASNTLATTSGNCMSLAILTTALADTARMEIGYQLMDDVPVYEFNEQLVKKGVHIRSVIYDPGFEMEEPLPAFSRPRITIDYFPTNRQRFVNNMGARDYLAMYYQNLAVEFLEEENLDYAYWYALEALQHAPDYSPAMNTLAVVNRRAGYIDTAEAIYQFGITHADDKLSLLKNYHALLLSGGRDKEADKVQSQLAAIDDPSPSHWFQLARTSYSEGEYREAIRFYRRALKLAPYLHEAHFGIAQASFELGRYRQTQAALEDALGEAEKVSTRNLYEAKLVSLSRE